MTWLVALVLMPVWVPVVAVAIWWWRDNAQQKRAARAAAAMARRYLEAAATERSGGDDVGKHDAGQPDAVTVPDLLRQAIAAGEALRLAWAEDADEPALMRPYVQDEYPTAVLPRITGDDVPPDIPPQATAGPGSLLSFYTL